MKRHSVVSSNIDYVGYEESSQTLEITFRSGGVYEYSNVPEPIFSALRAASSVGRYFAVHIKDHYRCSKIR